MRFICFLVTFLLVSTALLAQQDVPNEKQKKAFEIINNIKILVLNIKDQPETKELEISFIRLEDLVLSIQDNNLELELDTDRKGVLKEAARLLYNRWVINEKNLPEYNETILKRELSRYLNKYNSIDLDKLTEMFTVKLNKKLYNREEEMTADELNIMADIIPYYLYKLEMKNDFVWDDRITNIIFLENGVLANIKTFAYTKRLELIFSYLEHLDKIVHLGFINTANGALSRSFDLLKIKKAKGELNAPLFRK